MEVKFISTLLECSWPLGVGVMSNCTMGLFGEQTSTQFPQKRCSVPKTVLQCNLTQYRPSLLRIAKMAKGLTVKTLNFKTRLGAEHFFVIMVSFASE